MRVALLAGIVGLGAAAVGYALFALLAARLAGIATRRSGSAALAMRLLPSAGGLLAAGGLMVPAFVLHEPARAAERPGRMALILATAGLVLAGSTVRRSWRAWHATRRLRGEWKRTAEPLVTTNGPAPAYRIAHPFPVVAVVGVLRPRLFVARSVLEALTPAELHAVLEHEAAHVRARDNVKRWLVACAPSLGWRPAALRLERAWEEAAEHEADRASCGGLDLASALVKTARLAPLGPGLFAPAAAFHGGGNVARRIRELVEDRPAGGRRGVGMAVLLAGAGLVTAALPLAWPLAHHWAETLVHLP